MSEGLVRLGIDYENPSRRWWESGGQELWEGLAEAPDAPSVVVDAPIADSWLVEAARIDGWADGPDYAPHPIQRSDVDADEDV